ncbi:MAG TPA: hypothetical protein VJA25_13980, partial [Dehalococcoidia bacterium]|nr:hypothetical protein [Dehalococcoidia bacterium]
KGMTVEQGALENSANKFEADIYPTDVRFFGDTIAGGFDGDPHLTILTTSFKGAAGYYSSPDEYPKVVHSYSNQRLMLYINGNSLRPGSVSFNSVVSHELQHAIHWHADPNEESWVNEGLSVLAEDLNGFRPAMARVFEQGPEIQLTLWEDAPADNGVTKDSDVRGIDVSLELVRRVLQRPLLYGHLLVYVPVGVGSDDPQRSGHRKTRVALEVRYGENLLSPHLLGRWWRFHRLGERSTRFQTKPSCDFKRVGVGRLRYLRPLHVMERLRRRRGGLPCCDGGRRDAPLIL